MAPPGEATSTPPHHPSPPRPVILSILTLCAALFVLSLSLIFLFLGWFALVWWGLSLHCLLDHFLPVKNYKQPRCPLVMSG